MHIVIITQFLCWFSAPPPSFIYFKSVSNSDSGQTPPPPPLVPFSLHSLVFLAGFPYIVWWRLTINRKLTINFSLWQEDPWYHFPQLINLLDICRVIGLLVGPVHRAIGNLLVGSWSLTIFVFSPWCMRCIPFYTYKSWCWCRLHCDWQ